MHKGESRSNVSPQFLTATARRKSPRKKSKWIKIRESVQTKDLWKTSGIPEKKWKTMDLAKILTDSWLTDKADLDSDSALKAIPDFLTPKKQVELLEKTSSELNNINSRVTQTLLQYETSNNQDDVFKLLDEDDDVQFTTGFDRKSIMEESKGKVKVLIVDYDNVGLKRENVLRELYEEMKNDTITEEELEEDDSSQRFGEDTVTGLLASAHTAKDKLLNIHEDLMDQYVSQLRTVSSRPPEKAVSSWSDEQVAKMQKDQDEATTLIQDLEGRCYSLERILEKRDEELKFLRGNDSAKAGQLKEELFAFQQQGQEREKELRLELENTKAQLERAQQQLDMWIVDLQTQEKKQQENEEPDPNELKMVLAKSIVARKQVVSKLKVLAGELQSQRAVQESQVKMVRAQKEENFNERLSKLRIEQRAELESLKTEHRRKLEHLQKTFQERFEQHTKEYEEVLKKEDSQEIADVLRKTYETRVELHQQGVQNEIQSLKEQLQESQQRANEEWEHKLNLVKGTHLAEKEKLANEIEAHYQSEIGQLRHEYETTQASRELESIQKLNSLKWSLAVDLKELQEQLAKKEITIIDMTNKVEYLNEMVLREHTKLENELKEKEAQQPLNYSVMSEERRKNEHQLEKKKAVELAQHKMKVEREAAISALTAKFEMEKEAIFERQRHLLKEEFRHSSEQTLQETQLGLETEIQFLQDEVDILKKQLEREREAREKNSAITMELASQKNKYEKTISTIKDKYEEELRLKEMELKRAKEMFQVTSEAVEKHALELADLAEEPVMAKSVSTPLPFRSYVSHTRASSPSADQQTNSLRELLRINEDRRKEVELENVSLHQRINLLLVENAGLKEDISQLEMDEEEEGSDADSETPEIDDSTKVPTEEEREQPREGQKESTKEGQGQSEGEQKQPKEEQEESTKDEQERSKEGQEESTKEEQERSKQEQEQSKEKEKSSTSPTRRSLPKNSQRQLGKSKSSKKSQQNLSQVNSRLELLEETLVERNELLTRVSFLEHQLASSREEVTATESKKHAIESQLHSLLSQEAQSSLRQDPIPSSAKDLERVESAISEERQFLRQRIEQLERQLLRDASHASERLNNFKTDSQRKREALQKQHQDLLESLTEAYERRIKGLTDALTACLNDDDLADELRREKEESLRSAKLVNEQEMIRVREKMKRLEEDHRSSLHKLEHNDRSELKRMHSLIEGLKREFALLLEEEKMSLGEGEQQHAEMLEQLKQEMSLAQVNLRHHLEKGEHSEDLEFKELIDSGIQSVSSLYNAMSAIVRNRRKLNNKSIKDKLRAVGTLQEEMSAALRENDEPEEKPNVPQVASLSQSPEMSLAQMKALLAKQEYVIRTFQEKHTQHERVVEELLRHPLPNREEYANVLQQEANHLRQTNTDIQRYKLTQESQYRNLQSLRIHYHSLSDPSLPVSDLSLPTYSLRGSTPLGPITSNLISSNSPSSRLQTFPSSVPFPPSSPAHVKRHEMHSVHPKLVSFPGEKNPARPRDSSLPAAQHPLGFPDIQRFPEGQTPEHSHRNSHKSPSALRPSDRYDPTRSYDRYDPPRGATIGISPREFERRSKEKSLTGPKATREDSYTTRSDGSRVIDMAPLRIEGFGGGDRQQTMFLERVWAGVQRLSIADDEDRRRREAAAQLLHQDRLLRAQKVGLTFAKLHERMKLKIVQRSLEKQKRPNDRLARALKRIEERHQKASEKWESKRREILEIRRSHWLKVMGAISDVVSYRSTVSISVPFTLENIDNSIVVISYDNTRTSSPSLAQDYLAEHEKGQKETEVYEHSINFKRYYPFAHKPAKPSEKVSFSSFPHVRSLFDVGSEEGKRQSLDEWKGIEGRRIFSQADNYIPKENVLAEHFEATPVQTRPHSAESISTTLPPIKVLKTENQRPST